ncbi:unnamed protein product [Psylliodes chrysocephalus]|uniref:Protein takeout n=1 Tax=Psylliodes chrysocephalus TaxID=3402493 RepID=A0A9P0D4S7_9CUCU|nr:unnamed protein product [Psylliodes chrysocephala]
MGFCVKVGLLFVTVVCFSTHAAKLPSTFGRCSPKDEEFNECLKKNVEDAIHQLKKESPELGLSTLDPLDIPKLVIGEGTGPVHVVQNFKNVKLYGLTGSIVLSTSIDFENHIMHARSITPELRLQGEYTMRGKVMLLPIYGDGLCNITLYNTKINHTLYAEPFQKKGKTHWNFSNYTVTLRPDKMTYKFDNLFSGDERLGSNILNVLNENWNEVFTDVRDGYEKSFGLIFHGLANRVFSRVALNDIFLDME